MPSKKGTSSFLPLISEFPSIIPVIYTLKYPFPPNTFGSAYESNATAIINTILKPGV